MFDRTQRIAKSKDDNPAFTVNSMVPALSPRSEERTVSERPQAPQQGHLRYVYAN